jgi:hypothetical protein
VDDGVASRGVGAGPGDVDRHRPSLAGGVRRGRAFPVGPFTITCTRGGPVGHNGPVALDPGSTRWRRVGVADRDAARSTREYWARYGDGRRITSSVDVSAGVSTNRVFLLTLDDGRHLFAKVSNYGSAFLFREDHDRVLRLIDGLHGTRFERLLARPLDRVDEWGRRRVNTSYDGTVWVVFYEEVERRESLPRVLENDDIECLAREMAAFHRTCAEVTVRDRVPPTSTSITSDIVHLLDLVSDRTASRTLQLDADALRMVRRHGERFLTALDDIGYADMTRIPVFVDWNLGNFSVSRRPDASFELFSRWDYDWFRTDTALLDFYFLSRVSSKTGDRTRWSYGVHTLAEPRFLRFLAAYREVVPLTEADIEMIVETYRFFILHYVISVGDHFFRTDLWNAFRNDAVLRGLPSVDAFDRSVLTKRLR